MAAPSSVAASPAPSASLSANHTDNLTTWLIKHFVSRLRQDVYAAYFPPQTAAEKGGYYPVRRSKAKDAGYLAIDAEAVKRHVLNTKPLGCYLMAPSNDGRIKAAVVDLDDKSRALSWDELVAVARDIDCRLGEIGLLSFAVRSGSGHGIHLWLLWNDWQPASAVRGLLSGIVKEVGDACHIDIFPAQGSLGGGLGNLVALPFSRASRPLDLTTGAVVEDLGGWMLVEPGLSRGVSGSDLGTAWTDTDALAKDAGRGLQLMADGDLKLGPVDPTYLAEALSFVDAADYETWKRITLAIKVAVDNGQLSAQDGFKVWDDWSRTGGEAYNELENDKQWNRGFRPKEGGVTLGTVFHEAEKGGWKRPPDIAPLVVGPPPVSLGELVVANQGHSDASSSEDLDMADSMVNVAESDDADNDELLKEEMGWLRGGGGSEIDKINKKHFIARDGGKVHLFVEEHDHELKRKILTKISVNDFKVFYINRQVLIRTTRNGVPITKPLGDYWIESPYRRQYRQLVLEPGKQGCKPWQYNLWQGWSVQPSAEGSWDLLKKHTFDNICRGDEVAYEYLINWMAYTFQKPTKPIGSAIVLRGNKGTGKSAFVRAFGALFAKHFMQITNAKAITGNFNSHLRSCIMLFADEAVWAGNRAEESTLKAYITEPTLQIEGKGKDAITCRNMLHVLIATNHDWAAPVSIDERRFCCLNVSDAQQQNKSYFQAIQRQQRNGGSERLLHDMLTRDISKFDPQRVPMTDEYTEQKLRSMLSHGKWWRHRLEEGSLHEGADRWEEKTPAIAVYQDYLSFCQDIGERNFLGAPEILSKWLEELIGRKIESHKARAPFEGVTKLRTIWKFPPLHECRNYFRKKLKAKITWNKWPEEIVNDPAQEDDGLMSGTLDF